MFFMTRGLERAGYDVCNIDYPSSASSVEELAANEVLPAIERCWSQRPERIHFVTHSLGGIVVRQLAAEGSGVDAGEVKDLFKDLEANIVRQRIINNEPRIDGRDNKTVRPISVEVGILPRAHGSALFTRGETQAIGVATLGTTRDAQLIDALEGERKDGFMLHYNFPPIRSAKRAA